MILGLGVTLCFWGNLIGTKLIVQKRHLINRSAVVLNRSFNGQAQLPQRCSPPSMVQSLDRFFGNVQCLRNCADVKPSYEYIDPIWVFLPNGLETG